MHRMRFRSIQVLCALMLALVAALAMPAQAFALDGVKYLDAQGDEQTQDDVTEVISSDTLWGADDDAEHWYVVQNTVTIGQRVTVTGKVHLILADDASLTVNGGINVVDGDSLSIYGQTGGTGKLVADAGFVIHYAGYAGIGSGNEETGGTVTITGGTVVAKGGSDGAGIGSGAFGSGGTVTIAGGTVTATGGFYGAGIGGGYHGSGGTVTITGGTVTATGASGSGIGAGLNGSDGGVFFTGEGCDAAIFASSEYGKAISDNDDKTGWSGVIFEGNTGQVYGGKAALAESFAVPEGSTLTIPGGSTLEIPEDVTLAVSKGATLTVSKGATVLNAGSITGEGAVSGEGSLQLVDDGSVSVATCTVSMYATGVAYINEKGEPAKTAEDVQVAVISSDTTTLTDGWYVAKGNVELNQRVTVTGKVHLILADGAKLTVGGGINVAGDNSLSIYGQERGTGKLVANGEYSDAGIGGGLEETGGYVTIAGGVVTATGGGNGAGIGGGDSGSGGSVTITGGTVTATGGDLGAGIGGGQFGSDGTITIAGGTVDATGGACCAGIGGGYGGSGGAVTIKGGTVTATGGCAAGSAGEGGAGIGSGFGGLLDSVTISGGTVTVAGNYNAAGIGAGASGSGGTVAITGGTVTATGGSGGAGIGGDGGVDYGLGDTVVTISGGTVTATGDDGIGSGSNGKDVIFSAGKNGHAVIIASSISDQSGKESDWSGVIFENGVGKVYGTNVAPTEDFTVPKDGALEVPSGTTLSIGEGVTATVPEGAVVNNYGSIEGDGVLEGDGTIYLLGNGSVADGVTNSVKTVRVTVGVTYVDEDGKDMQTADGIYVSVIESDSTSLGADDDAEHWYVVQGEVNIDQRVTVTGDVRLILADDASLTVNGGINVAGDNKLSIYGQRGSTGKLVADAGSELYSAGIGGGNYGSVGTIVVAGGSVTAKGGSFGAGIGGGLHGSGGAIVITGGTVAAQSRYGGAGIGSGDGGSGGSVTISGGTVGATGGVGAAGIGGGILGSGVTVAITGGTVTATGGRAGEGAPDDGAGIGTGSNGKDVTFSTGESGHAVIFANSACDEAISDQSGKDGWSGVIFENGEGEVYGSNVTPTESFAIPADHTLTVSDGSGLTVAKGVTMTNDGSVTLQNGSTFVNNGTLINNGTFTVITGADASGNGTIEGGITKADQPTANDITAIDVSADALTIKATVDGARGAVTYALVEGEGSAPDASDKAWREDARFTNLSAGKRYTAYVRYAGTDYYKAAVSDGVAVWTAQGAPATGTGYTIDYAAETAQAAKGYELKTADGTWTTKAIDIKPGDKLVVRAATVKDGAPASEPTTNTLSSRPACTIAKASATRSGNTFTAKAVAEDDASLALEYSLDGKTWQDDGTFDSADDIETVRVRSAATNDAFASEAQELHFGTIRFAEESFTYQGAPLTAKQLVASAAYGKAEADVANDLSFSYAPADEDEQAEHADGTPTDAGTYEVTAALKGKAADSDEDVAYWPYRATMQVTVKPQKLEADWFTVAAEGLTYTGSALTPTVSVAKDAPSYLPDAAGSAWSVSYSDNVNVGTAHAVVTGRGNFTGSVRLSFKIAKQAGATIALGDAKGKTYDGTAVAAPKVEDWGDYDGDKDAVTFTWRDADGNKLDGAPTAAGRYTVAASAPATDTQEAPTFSPAEPQTVVIEPKALTIGAGDAKVTYGSEAPGIKDVTLTGMDWAQGDVDAGKAQELEDALRAGLSLSWAADGEAYTPSAAAGSTFAAVLTWNGSDSAMLANYDISVNAKNPGTLTVTESDASDMTVAARNSAGDAQERYTYGDVITVEATLRPAKTRGANARTAARPNVAAVRLTCGDKVLADRADSVSVNDDGSYTFRFAYDTRGKGIAPDGAQALTVTFAGDNNLPAASASVQVMLQPLEVTASLSGDITKTYDGTNDFSGIALKLDGVLDGDDFSAVASGATSQADAGADLTFEVTEVEATGADKAFYVLDGTVAPGTATIKPAPLKDSWFTVAGADLTYTGSALTPAVSVTDDAPGYLPGTAGNAWSVAYEDNVNAGTAHVVVTGAGNFTGSVRLPFQIERAAVTVAVSMPSVVYTGSACADPQVAATDALGNTSDGAVTLAWYEADGNGSWTALASAPVEVGSYRVEAQVAKGANHLAGEGSAEFQILKQGSKLVVLGELASKTYDGKALTTPEVVDLGGYDGGAKAITFTWRDAAGNELEGAPVDAGTYTVTASAPATATQEAPSFNLATQTVSIYRAAQTLAADQVSTTAETAAGASDGTISVFGLAEGAAWEWRAAGEDEWTAAKGATVEGLAPGTYEVRLAGSTNYAASASVSATIQSFADTHGGIVFPDGSVDNGDGTVTLPNAGGVVTLPDGSQIELPGGTVVDPGVGTATLPESGGSVSAGDGSSIGLPGGSTVDLGTGTATLPEQGGSVKLPGGSTATVPGGSAVDVAGGTVAAPDGTTVAPGGDGELSVTFPDGETVTVPSGSTVNGSGAVTTPDGSTVKPDGSGDVVVTLPDGGVVQAPSGSTVHDDGTVTDPDGAPLKPTDTGGDSGEGDPDDDGSDDNKPGDDEADGEPGDDETGDNKPGDGTDDDEPGSDGSDDQPNNDEPGRDEPDSDQEAAFDGEDASSLTSTGDHTMFAAGLIAALALVPLGFGIMLRRR